MSFEAMNHTEENPEIIDMLKQCESRKSVDELFEKHGIRDKGKRIELLNKTMGSPETFYSFGEPDEEAKYQREVSILLTKPWEINEFYEKVGL